MAGHLSSPSDGPVTQLGPRSDAGRAPTRRRNALSAIAFPLVIVAAAAAWAFAAGIDHRYISFSDGAYTYIASVVAAHGAHTLYGTAVFSQPPLALLGAALAWHASPHVETIRAVLAVLAGIRSLLTYAVARRLGLERAAAAAAALIALTAPVRGQFSGLDGEALLGPLALGVVWAGLTRRWVLAGALAGAGLLVKLTWAPVLLVLAIVLARRDRSALGRAALAAAIVAVGLSALLVLVDDWSVGDIVDQVVVGQLHSGVQPLTTLGIVLVLVLLWWPLLVFVPAGVRRLPGSAPVLGAVTALLALATLKNGTFFNIFDPLEPFLAIVAVGGALEVWRRGTPAARALVAVCCAGLAVHVATITDSGLAKGLPFPLGSTFVHTNNEAQVDALAAAVASHSRAGASVLVNPFVALVAHRRVVADQGDWFILHALSTACGGDPHPAPSCRLWSQMTAAAKAGAVPLVSVDSNVVRFDPDFRAETGVAGRRPLLATTRPPLKTTLYGR